MKRLVFALIVLFYALTGALGQSTCDPSTPFFEADLTGNPDSLWISPSVVRDGQCCNGATKNSDRCIEFLITLDPGAEAIRFDVASGAMPSGSLFWQLNCGPMYPVGVDICVTGVGPHRITFCKPGNNENSYAISSIAEPEISPPAVSANFCTGTLNATNFDPSSITWTTTHPGSRGEFDSYLNCTSGCDSTIVDYIDGVPYVDVEVSGIPVGGCSSISVAETSRVYFVQDKFVDIQPDDPTICYGGTSTSITAVANGGAEPYTYKWSTGETTQSIDASSPGWYTVELSDTTGCPPVVDSIEVTAFMSPITADAGPDTESCENNPVITLNGSVQSATGGTWTGGAGTYSDPNDLNATYTPAPAEYGTTVEHVLTTTGNGSCPSASDTMLHTIVPAPVVNAGADQVKCANNASISLSGSVTNATGGLWSGGNGTYFPGDATLNTTYTPTAAEISSGSLTLTLTSEGNGSCNAVSDQLTVNFNPAPTIDAGGDQTVCANNADADLDADFTVATGVTWTTSGTGSFSNKDIATPTYTPSDDDINNGSVILTATTTGNGICNAVSDEVTLTITPAPTVNAGVDRTVCGNNASLNLTGTVSIATGGHWTGGSGTFSPDRNTLNATYTPSAGEISAGGVTLTLETTGNGLCIPESDPVTINITPTPTVDAGGDQTVCGNNSTLDLNGAVTIASGGNWSGGTGTFSPGRSAVDATYTPSASEVANGSATLTLTTTGNGNCNPVSETKTITITPAPTVDAGADESVCANNPVVNLNGSYTIAAGIEWTGGTASSFSDTTDPEATYTPSSSEVSDGAVTLTLTTTGNGLCNPVSDQKEIIITDAPTVNAGTNQTVCANNSVVSLNGTVTVAGGGSWSGGDGTYSPDNNTLNATYTPSASEINNGTATLTLTTTDNGSCNAVSDQMIITITDAPTVDAGTDQIVCGNNATISLNGNVNIATGGTWSGGSGSFSPGTNALNGSYTPSASEIADGSATLTLTTTGNGKCIPVQDQVGITITPAPTIDAGPDQTVCANNAEADLAASVTIATGVTWTSNGTGSFDNPNSATTTYLPSAEDISNGSVILTATSTGNGDCKVVSDQLTVSITPAPTANAGTDRTVCANNASVVLNGAVTVATGGTWSGGDGTYSPDANTLNATYTPSAGEISNGTAILTLTTTGNDNCNPVSDQLTIDITPAPTVSAGTDKSSCSNNPATDLTGSVTIATGGTWSGGSGVFTPNANTLNTTYTPTATEINNGMVTLSLTTTGNGNCKPVTDPMTITFTPSPTADAGPDQIVCANNPEVSLNGAVTVSSGGIWSGGNGTFSTDASDLNTVYTPASSEIDNGTVTLTLTTTGNGSCNPVSDQITINITPAPTVNAGSDRTVCANNSTVTLAGAVTVASGGVWSGGSGSFGDINSLTSTYTPSESEISDGFATLTLTTTGNGNCNPETDQVTINITPAPTADAGIDQLVCGNNPTVDLEGKISVASGGRWLYGAGSFSPNNTTLNTSYTPSQTEINTTFTELVLETTGNGNCEPVRDTMVIIISPEPAANAGTDQDVCINNPEVHLNGSVANASGRSWSGGEGIFVPDNSSLDAVYSPAGKEIVAGNTVTLSLTASRTSCLPESDDMVVTFTESPVVDAGPDQSVCSNNPDIQLDGMVSISSGGIWTGGNGTFSPDASSLNAVYTPTPAEVSSGSLTLTLTSTGNGNCNPESDDFTITFTPAPTADAGPNLSVCSNNSSADLSGSITIASGGSWSSSGTGTFAPNNSTLTATYIPSDEDKADSSVIITLTTTGNGNCLAVKDSAKINITPAPTADAGADFDICRNNAVADLSGSVTVASGGRWTGGGGTFAPDANTLNTTYTPTPQEIKDGSVTLTLITTGNDNCNLISDHVVISITPAPTVNAGSDQSVCGNTAEVQLNGQATVASGGQWTSSGTGSFSPDRNTLNATYQPSPADTLNGSVTLTLTTTGNGNCIAVTDAMKISFTPVPYANAGPDKVVCTNDFPVELDGSGTTSEWSGGTGTFSPGRNVHDPTYTPSPEEISNGSVTLTLTTIANGACDAVSDEISVTIPPGPEADAGTDITVCSDVSSVTLNGSISNAGGGTWTTTGAGSFNPGPDDLNAIYQPANSDFTDSTIVFVLTSTGNGNCSEEKDTLLMHFTPAPVISAGPDQTICADKSSMNLSGNVSVATGGIWESDGTGTFEDSTELSTTYYPSDADTAAGTVIFTITSTGNGLCNEVTDQMVLTITPAPTVDAGTDQTICADSSFIMLEGSVTVATGGNWSTSGTGTFSPSASNLNAQYFPSNTDTSNGSVTFTLTTSGNGDCSPVSEQITVSITPTPVVNAGQDQTVCADIGDIVLSGDVIHAGGGSWASSGSGSFSDANDLNTSYTLSPADSTAGSVTLSLTTTGNGTCAPVNDQAVISITPAPEAEAGPDQTVCANNADVILNGSVSVATGGTWSGGAGTFDDINSLKTTYTPSPAEIAAGSVTLTLTTTGNGTCKPVSDSLTVSITPAPTADAGADQIVCADTAGISLGGSVTVASGGVWTSDGTGYFSPADNDLNTTYIPSPEDTANGSILLILMTDGNGNCLPVYDTMEAEITPAPVVDAGPDFTVCGNNADLNLQGQISHATGGIWTAGTGSFTPDATSLTAGYLPSDIEISNGTATLTLTSTGNGNCKAVSDQVLVSITPAPEVNAGPDLTVCANNPVTNLSGTVSVASGAYWAGGTGTFNPDSNALNAIYSLSADEINDAGLSLVLTSVGNGDCVPVTDTVNISVNPAPVVNAGPDDTLCADVSTVQLNGSVSNATGGAWTTNGTGNFTPNANDLNALYNPSAGDKSAGKVTIVLASEGNGNCNAVTDTMEMIFTPAPTINAGADQTVCANNADVALDGAVTVSGGGGWTGGNGLFAPDTSDLQAVYTPSATEIANGTATLTLISTDNGDCQPVSDQVMITITPAPVADAGPDIEVCENNPSASLGGVISIATGGTWTGNGGTFSPDVNSLIAEYILSEAEIASGSTSLVLTSTGNGDCLAETDTVVISTTPAPEVNAGPNDTVCADQNSYSLSGNVLIASGGVWSTTGTGSFSPNPNDLNSSYNITASDKSKGDVSLILTSEGNGNCIAVSDTMELQINPAPSVDAGPDMTVCADTGYIQLNGAVTIANGGEWSGGSGSFSDIHDLNTTYTPTATEIANGLVSLTLTTTGNGLCNPVSDIINITITPAPTVNAGADQQICADLGYINLNGSTTVATGGTWTSDGSGTFSPDQNTLNSSYTLSSADTATGTLEFILTSTGNGLCKPVMDTMNVSIASAPLVYAGADKTICADSSGVSLSDASVVNAGSGEWTTSGSGTFSPNSSTVEATYIPSGNDIDISSVTLTLMSADNGLCNTVSDQVTVNITPAPTVNAGADQTVCASASGISLNGNLTVATGGKWTTGSGLGTFTPSDDNLSATFVPDPVQVNAGMATITLTTTGNGDCKAVNDKMFITFQPEPIVDAGPNMTICETATSTSLNGTVTNAVGGIWTTSGTGSFSNNLSLNTTYTPSSDDKIAGQITLYLSTYGNGKCSGKQDSLILKITPAPSADAGPEAICSDAAGIQLNGSVADAAGGSWATSGTGTFSPNQNILAPVYNPSADDETAGTVELVLSSTGNGPCAAARDTVILSITPVPDADAGTDQIVCANTGPVTLDGSITGASQGIWSSSGGGNFSPDPNTLNADYTPSAVDIINGTVTLTLTTTGTGLCKPASDQVKIRITPAPVASAGADRTVCADTSGIQLNGAVTVATGGEWSSTGGGTFIPDASTLNATYIPSATDISNGTVTLTLTTTGNGNCIEDTDEMSIRITPAPTANLGSDLTICADVENIAFNGSVTNASGRQWNSTGNGSFAPDSASQLVRYNVTPQDTANGFLKVFMTTTGNGLCKAVSDTADITITPAPTVSIGAGGICADSDTIQLDGSVTVAAGAYWHTDGSGEFVPDSSALDAKYIPSAADKSSGNILLTLTSTGNGTCNPVQDSMIINISPPPSVAAGKDSTICAANSGLVLDGEVTNAAGGYWSTSGSGSFSDSADLSAVYTASASDTANGSVELVLTTTGTGSCEAVTDTMQVSFTPAPVVDAGPGIVCSNNPVVELNGMVANAGGAIWSSGGDGIFTDAGSLSTNYTIGAGDNLNGTVTLTLTSTNNGICDAVSDNLVINVSDAPDSDAGADQTICADAGTISLSGYVINAGGGEWSSFDGTGNFSDSSELNTSYNLTDADTTSGSIHFVLTTTNNGICSPVTDTLQVIINPAPVVNAGPATVCANNADVDLSGYVLHAAGGKWSTTGDGSFADDNSLITTYTPGSNDLDNAPDTPVKLILTSTGMGTCKPVTDTLTLYITEPPTPDAGGPYTICANDSVTLNGSVTGANGGIWSATGSGSFSDPAELNSIYIPSAADTATGSIRFTLTTTGNGNCNAEQDSVTLSFDPVPVPYAGADQTVCADVASVAVNGAVVNATGGAWTTTGDGTFSTAGNLSSTYSPGTNDTANGSVILILNTTGNAACTSQSDSMEVFFDAVPVADAGPSSICADDAGIQLDATIYHATGGSWTTSGDGSFAPNANTADGIYLLSDNDRASGSVDLTITTTGNGTCSPVTDSLRINITAPPGVTANAVTDTLCADSDIELKGSVTGATGGSWTTNGTGTFTPDNNTLGTSYVPGPSEASSPSEVNLWFALETTGTSPCNPVSDTAFVTLTPAPVAIVNAGNDTSVCASNPNVPLRGQISVATGGEWSSTGSGIFAPDAYTLETTYMPDAADVTGSTVELVLRTTGNGLCKPVTDTMKVTITPAPQADAGPDSTICADAGSILLNGTVSDAAGGVWYTSGSGTFDDDSSLSAEYSISNGDIQDSIVVLTLQSTGNGACEAAWDSRTLYINPKPEVNAGFDQVVCADNRTIQLDGSIRFESGATWSTNGDGTFNPGPDDPAPTYTVSDNDTAQGTINLTLTTSGASGCQQYSDALTLTVTDAPSVDAGSDVTVCADTAGIQLSGAVTVASGGIWSTDGSGAFTPGAAGLTPSYLPSSADTARGTVWLHLTTTGNGSCNPVTDSIEVTLTPAPVISAGGDQTVCANNAAAPLDGSLTVATGGIWSGGNGTFNPDAGSLSSIYIPSAAERDAGTVNLTLTSTGNGDCKAVSDQMSIKITESPVVEAGPDQTVCANNAEVELNGSVTIAGGAYWHGGNGTFSSDSSDLRTSYTPSATEISAGSVKLYLTSTDNGNCTPVSDSMTMTFTDAPVVNAGTDNRICADKNSVALGGSVTVASGGTWTSSGSGTFSPSASDLNAVYRPSGADKSSGTVTLSLISTGNGNCLAETDDMELVIDPAPSINAGTDQTLCANNANASLDGSVNISSGGSWSGGAGSFTPDANALNATYTPAASEISNGSVTLTLTSTGNGLCNAVSDNVTLRFTDSPLVNAGSDQTVCANNADVQLNGAVSIATGGQWSGGAGSFSADADELNAIYTPAPSEIAAGSITLTLTSTGNGKCIAETDQVEIDITPAPSINAGSDMTICADQDMVSLSPFVTVATGGSWSTSGSGYFAPDATTLNTTYNISSADTTEGAVTLKLISTGNGDCLAVTDSFTINIDPAPIADAGQDQTLCANNAILSLEGKIHNTSGGQWSGGAGSFNPGPGTLNAEYTPDNTEIANGSVTLTLTSTGNGLCNAVEDRMTIFFTPAPVANAGSDQTVCGNNPDMQLKGSVKIAEGGIWSGGGGTFSPSADELNAGYTPDNTEITGGGGDLILTTTGNGDCIPVSDDMEFTVTPSPVVDAGKDQVVCADIDNVQLSGSVSIASGGQWSTSGSGTFSPNAVTPDAKYIPSEEDRSKGQVTLTLTSTGNGNCLAESDFMVLDITPAPTADAGEDITVCADQDRVSLSGNITVASGAQWSSGGTGSFIPFDFILNPQYVLSESDKQSGRVILTMTTTGNGTCKPVSDQLAVNITPAPVADAGVDQNVCANSTSIPVNGKVTVASGGTWSSTGNGTFTPGRNNLSSSYKPTTADTSNGSVSLILTTTGNGLCQAVEDTVLFTFDPVPVANTGGEKICADESGAEISGLVYNAAGGNWTSSGSGYFAPNSSSLHAKYIPSQDDIDTRNITLTLNTTGNNSCEPQSDRMELLITPLPVADAGKDQVVCRGNTATIIAATSPDVSFNWYTLNGSRLGNEGMLEITVDKDTSAVLSVTDRKGCTTYDTMSIFAMDPPVFNMADQVCYDDNLTINSSPSVIPVPGDFQWYRNDTILSGESKTDHKVESPGVHVIGYNYGMCSVFDTTTVTPLPDLNGADKTICIGDINTISTSAIPKATYSWKNSSGNIIGTNSETLQVTGLNTQDYTVRVTDSLGCSDTDVITLFVSPKPEHDLKNTFACIGDTEFLDGTPTNVPDINSDYTWYRNGNRLDSKAKSLPVTTEGLYLLEYSLDECVSYDSARVSFNELPTPENTDTVRFCRETEGTVTLDAGPASAYHWYENNSTRQTFSASEEGYQYFRIYNEHQCSVDDSIWVRNTCPPRVFTSSAFKPGGDVYEDRTFKVFGDYFTDFSLTIYNRWGEIIFHTNDPNEGWDGTYRGKDMEAGVYPYVIEYNSEFVEYRERKVQQGKVVLIR